MALSLPHNNMPADDLMQRLEIKLADWSTDKFDLQNIRRKVFIEEQKVPEALEWDEFDNTSLHFLAMLDDSAVATARLMPNGQIGRMAVLAEYRNKGLGKQLLQFVLQQAKKNKLKKIHLHAQTSALAFYEKQGFTTSSEVFYEANIPHREMLKEIC